MVNKIASESGVGRDRRSTRERVERFIWRTYKRLRQRPGEENQRQFVFVAGCQRSGTNMLMELLDWSAHTDVYHETDDRAFIQYELRSRPELHLLAKNSSARFFVIKCLCELDEIRELMDEFRPAKTLWILRAFEDSTRSALRSFGRFSDQLHRLARDRGSAGWRGRGMSDETHDILAGLDHPNISEASAAALMWYYRNILFFELGLHRRNDVKLIRYEDLVESKRDISEDIGRFLSLPDCSPWMTRYIETKAVSKLESTEIEPQVRDLCARLMNRFQNL